MFYNIRSLFKISRRQEFSVLIIVNQYDFVCIAETWLKNEQTESELIQPEYQCFRSDRKLPLKTTTHGGTMICVKSSINSEEAFFDSDTNGSAVACYVNINQKKILIVFCYNPPANSKHAYTSEDLTNLFNNINQLTRNCDDIIIYGDFNFSTINWCSLSSENFLEREFLSTSHLIKCLKTASRKYKDLHPKVLKLKSMLKKCCVNDKIEYEQNLAAERF